MPIAAILARQNPDGGWPYARGKSSTEPTAYAVMAALQSGEQEPARRGMTWIQSMQRADGGFPPQTGVDESTWVTALIALLPLELSGESVHARAIGWLMSTSGRETGTLYRFRQRLLGNSLPDDQKFSGWPWVPGAAAWVGPTSMAILALEQEAKRTGAAAVRARVSEGRNFLLARMCREGGWNHGSARPLGYDSRPYPETTGMALAALGGVPAETLGPSLDAARQFLRESRSTDAIHWLRLGLAAHGRLPADYRPPAATRALTLMETAVGLLVDEAVAGRGVLRV